MQAAFKLPFPVFLRHSLRWRMWLPSRWHLCLNFGGASYQFSPDGVERYNVRNGVFWLSGCRTLFPSPTTTTRWSFVSLFLPYLKTTSVWGYCTTHPSSPCSAGADPPSPCARRSLCSWLCSPRRRNPWAACASPVRRSGCLQGGSNGRLARAALRIWNTWNTWGGILGDRRAVAEVHLRGRPPDLSRCRLSSRTRSRGSSARKLSTLQIFRTSCNSASALHTNRNEHHLYLPHSYSLFFCLRTAVVWEIKSCSQGWVVTWNLWMQTTG